MSPRNLIQFWATGWVALALLLCIFDSSVLADDGGETTYDRNAEREWTDINGNAMTGRFSGVIRDEVLINSGGRVQRVKLSSLSEVDIAWLWGLHHQEGRLNQLPVEYRERPEVTVPETTTDDPMPVDPAPPDEATTPVDPPMPVDDDASAGEASLDLRTERVWTVNSNPVTGRFSGLIGAEILINAGGRVQRFPLSELSEYDLAWLWDVYNAQNKLADLPVEYRERPENPIRPEMTIADDAGPDDAPATEANADESYGTEAYRDWTTAEEPINARFMRFTTQDRLLVTDRGHMHTIEFDDLSPDDVAWLRGYHAHHGIESELPERLRPRTPNQPGGATIASLRDTRTWTDREGNTIQASFSSIHGEEVSLHRGSGQGWIDVHLAQLSIADLIWLQEALRNEGRLRELPLVFRDAPDDGQTEADLVRLRRQSGMRQWRLYNNQAFVAAFDRVEAGIVYVDLPETATQREEHWNDLSDADHEYLKERLRLETPADFFPAQRELSASPEQQAAGMRVWTDREGNQIVGSFKNLTAMNTVVVFDTAEGEARYIYEYLSNDDQAVIQGVTQQNQQTQIAQGGGAGAGYSSTPPGFSAGPPSFNSGYPGFNGGSPGFSSGPSGVTGGPVGGHSGGSFPGTTGFNHPGGSVPQFGGPMGTHDEPFNSSFNEPSFPEVPSFTTGPQVPDIQVPTFEWVYKCSNCGTEFNESSGLKQGDPCPRCSGRRFNLPWWAYCLIIGIPVAIRLMNR